MFKKKKEIIAMLLAGGQGSRLYVLTKNTAKPAIPFGGKYRIIDFPLSNCINSGIDTVGVLTQYQPLELNSYIGNGIPWDLNRMNGGVHILPPYAKADSSEWYNGTANAVYQNIPFIEKYDPEYVLILSGDHIYKMDYSKMLDFHKKHGAACTVAALPVPIEEASRFGIMNTDENGQIYEFEEKPAHPKCNNASMGIYIFTWKKLREYLVADEQDPDSKNDFGGNILPNMINAGEKMMAYTFDGYWKDVGTIDSFWEANMDLLNPRIPLNLSDPDWKIYSRFEAMVPQYIGENAEIIESMVTENCKIDGKLWYSVLFSDVTVEEGAKLNSSVVMSGTTIGKNADIKYAIIADDVIIEEGAKIGDSPEFFANPNDWGIAVIGKGAIVKAGQVVKPNEMIEPYSGR
ncbi:MAG: glucose-1-phosphate adenylyltransferase [Clostridia bacterium]|nr:glucose-1-phosphate adenylyltransferase [Clostridia bacterium]